MKPRLLDLFCGAGGAAAGYHRAGFDVVGVDLVEQPNYPYKFVRADAIEILRNALHYYAGWARFDAIHASPPCQSFTVYRNSGVVGDYPDLVATTRQLLTATGRPYVMENVVGSPLRRWIRLCGSMFEESGGTKDIERHRLFETNWPVTGALELRCEHWRWEPDRYPGGRSKQRTGTSRGLVRGTIEIGSWDIPLAKQQEAMGIDWMTLEELSEAIPPAYTEFIGHQLMAALRVQAELFPEGVT